LVFWNRGSRCLRWSCSALYAHGNSHFVRCALLRVHWLGMLPPVSWLPMERDPVRILPSRNVRAQRPRRVPRYRKRVSTPRARSSEA